jgi:hypothetical protein
VRSDGAGAADFSLYGAVAEPDPDHGREFVAGERNTLRVSIARSHGSGPRDNEYATDLGPVDTGNRGEGNRIEFVGSEAEFSRSNEAIEPAPPADYFIGETSRP